MARKQIAVIGSLNVDFITRTSRIPSPGETLAAKSFDTGVGGKGANQAVASARLAAQDVVVEMVGNVGGDSFGNEYFEGLSKEGIVTSGIRKVETHKTGVSNIIVDESTGENRILFTANANYAFADRPDDDWDMVPSAADVIVLQLEMPMSVVLHNMHLAHDRGKHVIFNPAPAQSIPEHSYQDIDTLVMNETESCILSEGGIDSVGAQEPLATASQFLRRGVREAVIITLGGRGLVYATASGQRATMEAQRVSVVDTTAAGDVFVGAYAVQRAKHTEGDFDFITALQFANLAASKSVGKAGAMAPIPFRGDIT